MMSLAARANMRPKRVSHGLPARCLKHPLRCLLFRLCCSSHSGFQRQVEQEHRYGQLDDILEYFDAHEIGVAFGGPAAPRLKTTLKDATRQLEPLPARMADRGRIRIMLSDLARTLHVGVLADCFFDPATALCLKAATDQSKPQTALCQPTKCPNACIRTRHLPVWQKAEEEVNGLLKEKSLSTVQRAALKAERTRIRGVIGRGSPKS